MGQSAQLAAAYEFRSVELKQTAFRLDGILLPRSSWAEQTVIFVEIQFQADPHFYQRFFAEIFLFLRQNPQAVKWRAVVLFGKRSVEPKETTPFQTLLNSDQVSRVYLEEIQQTTPTSLGLGLVQLIVTESHQAIEQARSLLSQSKGQSFPLLSTAAIIELIETIVVYKFPQLSREEIEHMLGLSNIRQTRVYQEALQEGRQEGEASLILRLLTRRFGSITPDIEAQILVLPLPQLEALAEALLDFSEISNLTTWLQSTR